MPTLDWLNRQDAFALADRVPYRLLEPVSVHGDGAADNLLIQGDNLEALKALLPFCRGQVKCIFIDPPYNTRSAFEHYDDNLEHSHWLGIMPARLQVLRELLSEDGSGCPRFSRAKDARVFVRLDHGGFLPGALGIMVMFGPRSGLPCNAAPDHQSKCRTPNSRESIRLSEAAVVARSSTKQHWHVTVLEITEKPDHNRDVVEIKRGEQFAKFCRSSSVGV